MSNNETIQVKLHITKPHEASLNSHHYKSTSASRSLLPLYSPLWGLSSTPIRISL